jgi:hypothetical protein
VRFEVLTAVKMKMLVFWVADLQVDINVEEGHTIRAEEGSMFLQNVGIYLQVYNPEDRQ